MTTSPPALYFDSNTDKPLGVGAEAAFRCFIGQEGPRIFATLVTEGLDDVTKFVRVEEETEKVFLDAGDTSILVRFAHKGASKLYADWVTDSLRSFISSSFSAINYTAEQVIQSV